MQLPRLPTCSIAGFAMLLLVAGCETTAQLSGPSSRPPVTSRQPRGLYQWHDDGGPGQVTVRISLPDQIAEYKRGGRPIGWSYVATGKSGYSTQVGSYRIQEKVVDKRSTRYGRIEDQFGNVVDDDATSSDPVPPGTHYVAAYMPYWLRLTSNGVGMHAGIIPNPGQPASHGCIRLPRDFAPTLYGAVRIGTPVTITHQRAQQGPFEDSSRTQLALADSAAMLITKPALDPGLRRSQTVVPTATHGTTPASDRTVTR